MMTLLDDPSDTIRSSATAVLSSIFCAKGFEFYNSGESKGPDVIRAYKLWWKEHEGDFLDALVKERNKVEDTFPIDFSKDTSKDVPRLFREYTVGRISNTNMESFRRMVYLGSRAIPELKRIARDTSIHRHTEAFIILGHIGDTSIVPFMCESFDWAETIKKETITYGNVRHGIVHGLDRLLKLGSYNPGDPNEEQIVQIYKKMVRR